ncbi:MAG: DUF427 domain-containing protein [Longimicrobiales bacterium]|nr:DUF427 domain-containing protein [Longimicrobiales bacterium]
MSLTLGRAPLAHPPAGDRNFDLDLPDTVLYMEDVFQRVRVYLGGEKVADSARVRILHQSDDVPRYCFPAEDVRMDLLEESGRGESEVKGPVTYYTVAAGDGRAEDAAWQHTGPPDSASFLEGLVTFDWDAMDAWFEEEDEVVVHPKDPYHRVDVLRSTRRVRIALDGVELADSRRAVVLLETSLPPRFYLPADDVAMDRLEPSDTHTRCPYKGVASYYSVGTDEGLHEDLVWYYPDAAAHVERIAGRLAFYNERVDLELDGQPQERPVTHFS